MTNVGSVLDAVRQTAEERIAPQAARIDGERAFPDDNLKALGDAGGLGLVVPADHGGAGGALSALAEAGDALRGLMRAMERNRIRRLRSAGFDAPTARYLSDLHTPNLM